MVILEYQNGSSEERCANLILGNSKTFKVNAWYFQEKVNFDGFMVIQGHFQKKVSFYWWEFDYLLFWGNERFGWDHGLDKAIW